MVSSDYKVTLEQEGGETVLLVIVRRRPALSELVNEFNKSGRLSFPAKEFPPPIAELRVVLEWVDQRESFRGRIVSWRPGDATIKPVLTAPEFEELVYRLHKARNPLEQSAGPAPFSRRPSSARVSRPATSPIVDRPGSGTVDRPQSGTFDRPSSGRFVSQPSPKGFERPASNARVPAPGAGFDPSASGLYQAPDSTDEALADVEPTTPEGLALTFLRELELPPPSIKGTDQGAAVLAMTTTLAADSPVLTIARSSTSKRRWFLFGAEGTTQYAYQLPATEGTTLVRLLQHQSQLKRDQADDILARAARENVPEEVVLTDEDVLPDGFLGRAIHAKVSVLTRQLRDESDVIFSIFKLDCLPNGLKPLKATAPPAPSSGGGDLTQIKTMLDAYIEYPWNKSKETMEPFLSHCPHLRADKRDQLERIKLGDKVSRFLDNCLDGTHRLHDVFKITNLSRRNSFALIFALHDAGFLEFNDRPVDEVLTAELIEIVNNRHATLDRGSLFEKLDLHWGATTEDIVEAQERIQKLLAKATPERVGQEVADKAMEVVMGTREAAENLSTERARREHRLTFLEPFNIEQGVVLMATQLDMAVYRKDRRDAERLLKRIEELDPSMGRGKRTETMRRLREPTK